MIGDGSKIKQCTGAGCSSSISIRSICHVYALGLVIERMCKEWCICVYILQIHQRIQKKTPFHYKIDYQWKLIYEITSGSKTEYLGSELPIGLSLTIFTKVVGAWLMIEDLWSASKLRS